MVRIEDLKKIHLLKGIPSEQLEKIAAEAQLNFFSADTVLFRRNDKIDYFYMVLMGQVALEIDMSEELNIILATIKSGYSFGVSSLVSGARASSTAICQEPCELIMLSVDRLTRLFQEDPFLGYKFMFKLASVFQKIMDNRSQMIMKTLDLHPELRSTLGDVEFLAPVF